MNTKPIVLKAAALAAMLLAVSCTLRIGGQKMENLRGKGELLTRDYDLSDFDAIRISGCYDVRFVQTGGEYAVSVETFENIFEYIDLRVEGTTLVLDQKLKRFRTDKLNVTVKGPSLRCVRVAGSADLDMDGFRSAEDLEMLVSGAGNFDLRNISCRGLKIEVSGAGDLNVRKLDCESASVSVSGAGDVDMDFVAASEVNVSVSGAGDITLSGKADKVFCQISGVGNVDARSLTYDSFDSAKAGIGNIKK